MTCLMVLTSPQPAAMMLVLPSIPPPPDSRGDVMDMTPFHDQPSGPKLNEEQRDGGRSQEGDPEEFGGYAYMLPPSEGVRCSEVFASRTDLFVFLFSGWTGSGSSGTTL